MAEIKKIFVNGKDEVEFFKQLEKRSGETNKKVTAVVNEIIETVREGGDNAVKAYTEKFDGKLPEYYEVPRDVINDALTEADQDFVDAMLNAVANITDFHQRQKSQSFINAKDNGCILGQKVRGLNRVGLYVPGGTAAYPSSVLMNAVPAKIAGVKEIIMVTPPLKDGTPNKDILVAAALCGVDIDMVAGPSEILVMADEKANPKFIAADLMSQAEHDKLASAILVTTSESIADRTIEEINRQVQSLSRKEIIESSLENYGAILICNTKDEACDLANRFAPEHLEVLFENPMEYLGRLDNAGSIFLGQYASEPLGDYYAGPNHVLPTSGTARFFSPLSVNSFEKRSSFTYYTEDALREAKDDIVLIAEKEGLTAHANAIKVRF